MIYLLFLLTFHRSFRSNPQIPVETIGLVKMANTVYREKARIKLWCGKKKMDYTFLTVISISGHIYVIASVVTAAPVNMPKLVRARSPRQRWHCVCHIHAAHCSQKARRSGARARQWAPAEPHECSQLRHGCTRQSYSSDCWARSAKLQGTGAYLI